MKTEEELMAAFEAGTLTQEEEDRFLIGESFDGDTKTDPPPVATDEEAGKEPEIKAEPEQKQEPEAVVLAKDGKHTLPFSVVEGLRADVQAAKEESAQLRQALEEQKGLLQKLTAAQVTDEQAGNDKEKTKILAMLEEDYPGITEELRSTFIDPVKAELEPLKADREATVKQTAEEAARTEFDNAIAAIEPTYLEVSAKPEFWRWFNEQSPLVKAAQTSGDPAVVADVIKLYNSQQAPVSDKTQAAQEKVKAAMEKAASQSAVQTLSDVPGGSNPAADAIEAFARLPEREQLAKLMNMDTDKIHEFLDRIV